MKSYIDITTRYLKLHKKRTLLTIIGIIMSVALICALGTIIYSFGDNRIETSKKYSGDYEAAYSNLSSKEADIIKNHASLKNVSLTTTLGLTKIYDTPKEALKPSIPKYRFINLKAFDENAFDKTFNIELLEGTYPKNKNEIIVERGALKYLKPDIKIGDTVVLYFGDRKVPNSTKTLPENSWSDDESFEVTSKLEFKLVGICKEKGFGTRNITFNGYTYLEEDMKKENITAYTNIISKANKRDIAKEIAHNINPNIELKFNNELLKYYAQGSNLDLNKTLLGTIIFIVSIIVICTIAVIYNSFNISVIERISQFGILRSVGATPSQIRKIVFKEAFMMSIIGIPLGLLSGVYAMKILLLVLGNISFLGSSSNSSFKMNVHIEVLLISSLIGILTIFLSVILPARAAGKISPLEAVRNPSALKIRNIKKVSKGKIIGLFFKTEGILAYKNVNRNKKRFLVTVFSLVISIVMFITFNTFIDYVKLSNDPNKTKYFDAFYISYGGTPFTDSDYSEMKKLPGVEAAYKYMDTDTMIAIPKNKINPKYEERTTRKPYIEEYKDYAFIHNFRIMGFDNEALKLCEKTLLDGKIDIDALDNMGIILVNKNVVINNKSKEIKENFSTYKVGDIIKLPKTSDISDYDKQLGEIKNSIDNNNFWNLKILAIIDYEPVLTTSPQDSLFFITTEKAYTTLVGNKNFTKIPMKLSEDNSKREEVRKYFEDKSIYETTQFYDYKESAEKNKRMELELSVLVYGFISVITLISSVNIINTISTNLLLRKREFATLQAIGMTQQQLKNMIYLEGTLHGIVASIIGSVVGCMLSYVLNKLIGNSFDIPWIIPYKAILISTAGAILITLLSTLLPLRKIKSQNIVDTIRMEE
ncbi:ABC transporter permease [Desnuesiella massiliensis]|uniref:ABC transporter permease n=1 Tax=Desnuesiella massiliensis TaxID=1650662 RepID=UPI0006E3BA05|nr:ABC transporter permease [Desnuesiella massiliensis]